MRHVHSERGRAGAAGGPGERQDPALRGAAVPSAARLWPALRTFRSSARSIGWGIKSATPSRSRPPHGSRTPDRWPWPRSGRAPGLPRRLAARAPPCPRRRRRRSDAWHPFAAQEARGKRLECADPQVEFGAVASRERLAELLLQRRRSHDPGNVARLLGDHHGRTSLRMGEHPHESPGRHPTSVFKEMFEVNQMYN
jgi:hypothetical protein